jgi:pSer/pThr/pTyr-binding forkhead associated (FHA) protein
MAYLFDVAAETFFPLAPHHTFGRLASVDTQLDKPYISKLHSAIEWNGRCWRIKNLGLNGTWINDVQLGQGEMADLNVNDHIHLAEQAEPGFRVIDLAPPSDMLWPLDMSPEQMPSQVQPIPLERYHLLPDTQTPELALYFDHQDQAWYAELMSSATQEQRRETIQHGDILQFDNLRWQFISAQVYGPTEARVRSSHKLSDFEFVFNLSLDEETTQLELRQSQHSIDLAVRSHHYLMLQLARHRADDAAQGLDAKSQGWVYADQLANELGLDSTHMNIHIFRARKQLADCLPDSSDHQCLLERRGGKIRFGCDRFKIYKGDQLTTALPLATDISSA